MSGEIFTFKIYFYTTQNNLISLVYLECLYPFVNNMSCSILLNFIQQQVITQSEAKQVVLWSEFLGLSQIRFPANSVCLRQPMKTKIESRQILPIRVASYITKSILYTFRLNLVLLNIIKRQNASDLQAILLPYRF